jgi:malic enzyme
MGKAGLGASVIDAGALIAFERLDRRARAAFRERTGPLIIPAPVLAQVWRDSARQVLLARLVQAQGTVVEPLDSARAKAAGVLLGRSGTSDVVDASVVLSARSHKAVVLTSDPEDLRRIDPDVAIEVV